MEVVSVELLYERARKEAQNIRGRSSIGEGLKDLKEIARRWDAVVYFEPLEEGLSGFIIKDEGSSPRIYINRLESQERQRFTLAHEIGHLIERRELAYDDEYSFLDRRGEEYDLHEFFADEFAGELLMPAERITELSEDGASKYSVAKALDVSIPALERRVARLLKNQPVEGFPAPGWIVIGLVHRKTSHLPGEEK